LDFMKYLLRNITVLNVVLAAVVAAWAGTVISPMVHTSASFTPPAVKKTEPQKEEIPAQSQVPSPQDYTLIADQNLFHPERKIPVEKPPGPPPPPPPEFVLYGTLVTDGTSVAYMEDRKAPQSTAGRGKRQVSLKRGETLSGFVVREIDADKVVMARGEESITVLLNDAQRPKTREGITTTAGPQPGPQGTAQGVPPQPAAQRAAAAAQHAAPSVPQPASQPATAATTPAPRQPVAGSTAPASPEEARKSFLDFFKRR
jgi:type II secretory pathway component PulC